MERIKGLGASLMAISPETTENSMSTAQYNDLTLEVLSDKGNNVARQFGIVFQLPMELREIYAGFGIDIASVHGDKSFELPIPATYIIGSDGRVKKAFVEADYTKRLDPESIIQALEQMATEMKEIQTQR
jgi:peroxiredoxin